MRWWILTLIILASCEKEVITEAVRPVKTIVVKESTSEDNQTIFPGTLRAFKRADLSFRVDGMVVMRDIFVGYRARSGETLMQLDPREYEISLKKAQGSVDSIQAQLDFAARDYERMKNIYERDPGAISLSLLDRKKEANNKLQAELIVAQGDVDKAADNLAYTSLKAPFDGIVAAIYVENHEQVRAKQTVLRFLDLADREMEINVPEKLINNLLEGKNTLTFEVRLNAFPDQALTAQIKEIGTEASTTTLTYPVTLSIHDIPIEFSLLAGMSGRAILTNASGIIKDQFNIPKSAIFTENGQGSYVWAVDPKTETVHRKAVTIDDNYKGTNVIVKKGLTSGDRIVIAGTSFLVEGQRIRIDVEQPKP